MQLMMRQVIMSLGSFLADTKIDLSTE